MQVLVRELILRLASIDHAEQFVSFEAVGNLVEELLQLPSGFRKVTGVVLCHSSLKLAVKFLVAIRRNGMTLRERTGSDQGMPKENG